MIRKVLVDSAGWIGLLHSGDELHARAVETYAQIIDEGCSLVTTSLILVEVASAFSSPGLRSLAVELADRYRRSEIGELIWIDAEIYDQSWELYRARDDKAWSFVDCASFVVMQDQGITEALTSDRHFEQAGFAKLL